jgi:S1-C subfamily serine protease
MSERGRVILGFMTVAMTAALSLGAVPAATGSEDVSVENISRKVFPSVVKVEARNGLTRVATGVVIDKDGYIATTALISARDEEIFVTTSDGRRAEAKFLGWDPETHLALLQAKEKNLTPIVMAKSGELAPGAWVGVISMSPENTPSVTQGIVSSSAPDRLRLNVWVTRGSSGSPVVNKEGQMVALLRGIYTEDQPVLFEFREKEVVGSGYVFDHAEAPSSGMALGIPVEIVKSISAEIKESGKVSRAWMGVAIAENDKAQVVIGNIEGDSPAELAKLKEGDVLVAIDGKKITGGQAFVSEIRTKKPGQDVDLQIDREGKTMSVKVKLGEYPEAEAKRELEARFPRLFPPGQPLRPGEAPAPPRDFEQFKVFGAPKAGEAWPTWEKRKYVGLYLEELNPDLLLYFGIKEGSGLLVNRLTKGSPAEKAGLKVGDVLVRVDGKKVESVADLSALIQDKKKGEKVKFDIVRDKKPMSVEVEVGEDEGPSLSDLLRSLPSPDEWGAMGKEMAQEYDRSHEVYEKFNYDQRDNLKKLTGQLADQGKKYRELAKEYAAKGKAETGRLLKSVKAKNQVLYRV